MNVPTHKVVYRNPPSNVLHEYGCHDCENVQSEWHSNQSNPVIVCNKCGSKNTFKYIGPRNFILRGRGFPSKELKIEKEIADQDKIAREGWRSQSEIQEAQHALRERDERLAKNGQKYLPTERGEEIVEKKMTVSKSQIRQLESQISGASDHVEKVLLQKQLNRVLESDGKVVKKRVTKKLGADKLKSAAKKQREAIKGVT